MAKKRNAWEGRGTFKNPKWEWTKGSICLRSCVFHHRCRQLAAAPLKTISIPSTDASTCPPPFALSVRCRVNSHSAIARRGRNANEIIRDGRFTFLASRDPRQADPMSRTFPASFPPAGIYRYSGTVRTVRNFPDVSALKIRETRVPDRDGRVNAQFRCRQ